MAQQARDEAGNIWDVSDPANPVLVSHVATGGGTGRVIPKPVDPQATAELAGKTLGNQRTRQLIEQDAATQDADRRKAIAEARKSEQANADQPTDQRFARAKTLRGDYEALPSVKNYTQALPVFGAGLQSRPDAAGDLNLIYAYAKVMDPNSVVREGEQASVAGGDTWINAKVAQLQKQIGQGGTFKPEYRQRLREEMAGRMGELNQSFIADRVRYKGIADRFEVNPQDVVGEHPGERFQALSEKVLGRKQKELDYNGMSIATGPTRTERDDKTSALMDTLVRRGASLDEINASLTPLGMKPVEAAQYDAVKKYLAANPGYKGSFGEATREVPTTGWNRFAASPVGTGIYAAVDAGMGGLSDEVASIAGGGDLADLNARKQAAFVANPLSALAGQTVGTIGAMTGLGALGRSAGFASRFGIPGLAGDIAFGAASGAGQSNDNRLLGGSLGAIGGGVGHVVGTGVASGVGALARTRPGLAATNGLRGMFGASRLPAPTPLSSADNTVFNAINRAGVDNVRGALTEARGLNLPMSLADTNPNLRELAGAAVRRSPTAASFAEDALIPRSRGQFDRFTSAVDTNLGPTANIPQRSADLMTQARAGASDLYDQAYRNPVPSTPELDSVLATPFGRQALGRARTIAANERRSPDELGFALDADSNTVLNPMPNRAIADHLTARDGLNAAQDAYRAASGTAEKAAASARVQQARQVLRDAEQGLKAAPDPSLPANVPGYTTQTLDYVKRGMDDVLEEKRNPITGKLVLDEAGRAQNAVRGQLLSEVDRLNPDFATARASYAGPMQSRDALSRGVDAYGLQPDQLGMQVAGQAPEHLAQMQLGFRGALVDHAGKVRDNSNPWEATLGSPTSRQRLDTLYPDNPGVGQLLRQRDLEGTMAQTKDAVIGNSKTAGRQIMDKVFEGGGWPVALGEAALAVGTHGATLPLALRRFAGEGARDMYKLGLGGRATAKADAIAPVLLNTDPASGLSQIEQYLAQQEAYRALVERTTPKALGGMFGRAFGSQAAIAPLNQ